MAEGNSKGPDIEGSYRVVETTRNPDIKINQIPPQSNQTRTEKKSLPQKLFGKKSSADKATDAIKKGLDQSDQVTELGVRVDVDNRIAMNQTNQKIREMQSALGPDPAKSAEVEAKLLEMKKKRGLA